jgi:hypothetical protein
MRCTGDNSRAAHGGDAARRHFFWFEITASHLKSPLRDIEDMQAGTQKESEEGGGAGGRNGEKKEGEERRNFNRCMAPLAVRRRLQHGAVSNSMV